MSFYTCIISKKYIFLLTAFQLLPIWSILSSDEYLNEINKQIIVQATVTCNDSLFFLKETIIKNYFDSLCYKVDCTKENQFSAILSDDTKEDLQLLKTISFIPILFYGNDTNEDYLHRNGNSGVIKLIESGYIKFKKKDTFDIYTLNNKKLLTNFNEEYNWFFTNNKIICNQLIKVNNIEGTIDDFIDLLNSLKSIKNIPKNNTYYLLNVEKIQILKYIVENFKILDNEIKQIIPFIVNNQGLTFLHMASYIGDVDTTLDLIDINTHIDLTDKNNSTPLQYAVIGDNIFIARRLLKSHSNPDVQNNTGNTALHFAASKSYMGIFLLLLSAGANPKIKNYHGQTCADVRNMYGDTIFHFANDIKIIRHLLAAGLNPNCTDDQGNTPLITAVLKNNMEIVDALIQANADLDIKNNSGSTALSYAISNEKTEIVDRLIQANVNVDLPDNSGNTPLYYACLYQLEEIIILLIQANVNMNVQNNAGLTALHIAVLSNNKIIVDHLVKAGADLDMQNDNGSTALLFAQSQGNEEILRYLIDAKANLNSKDQYGNTVLHYAASARNQEIVAILLLAGANPRIKNNDNITASRYIFAMKHWS